MGNLPCAIVVALWLFFVPACSFGETEAAIRAADAVLAKTNNLDTFLARPELVEEYYHAVKQVYGGELDRAGFDAILGQLRTCNAHQD